jgi:nicotinamidase-related amidase
MKKLISLAILLLFAPFSFAQGPQKIRIKNDTLPTAFLMVDIQDFYFPGGKLPLVGAEKASEKAAHVQHTGGSPIHANLTPRPGERVITKTDVNSFEGTDLLDFLKFLGVKRLVICGMQTHMCLEAAVRAAHDYGFRCIVVQDACATRDLKWEKRTVKAAGVQASTMATLDRFYGIVTNAGNLE